MELQSKDTALLFKISHSNPIEMGDFVATMNALSVLFENFVKANADSSEGRKAKLYVEKIEHGSIEFYMVESIIACAIPFLENFNSIFEFASNLKHLVKNSISGKEESKLSISELKALRDLFSITSNDPKGVTTFDPVDRNNPTFIINNCSCSFDFGDSNSAQNQISKSIKRLERETPTEFVYEKQLMTIFQMRGDMTTNVGNKAVIESLSAKALPVVFDSEELKRRVLDNDDNPTKQAYLVDAVIMTANNRPTAYKIMALYEIIPLD